MIPLRASYFHFLSPPVRTTRSIVTMNPEERMTDDTRTRVAEILEFARASLGPRSMNVLSEPAAQALVFSRLRSGSELADAVLAEIHSRSRADRELADEFLGYFLLDAYRNGRRLVTPFLQRFVDTGDLVQSTFGDLWDELAGLTFETRAQFVSLLALRLRWKAQDHARRLRTQRRGEDKRSDVDPEQLGHADAEPTPASAAMASEERERLALALMRLPERDRLIVRLYLRGEALPEIMRATGLASEAARKALQRALLRARDAAR